MRRSRMWMAAATAVAVVAALGGANAAVAEPVKNDGMTWRDAQSGYFGDVGYAQIRHPAGNGFVSLRITARDANGSTVVQTVTRAYQIIAAG